MKTEWVDFKKLKQAVDMQMVLDHYGIKNLVKQRDEFRGPCPIHKDSVRSKNFTVNIRKNAFKCFSKDCGAHGNILDLVVAMEQCSVHEAGMKLQQWFRVEESESTRLDESASKVPEVSRGIYSDSDGALFEVVTTATKGGDFERFVVYRELFGEFNVWVTPMETFIQANSSDGLPFRLLKAL